jgi:hypothetical protein
MNPQKFDRYSYAQNNPLKYRDPTGLTFGCCDPEYELLCDGDQGDNATPGGGSGPLAVFCLFASGAVCSIAFGWLINGSGKLSITDIHKKMEENGCGCSVYCS